MQSQLKKLMKDLVYYALDVNIKIQSNTAKKSLFIRTVIAIKRFWLVQTPTPTESVFFWLAQLSLLVSLPTDKLDRIKSKSSLINPLTNLNCTKSKSSLVGPPTNPDRTKNKSLNGNCCKSNGAKSKKVGDEKVERDDLESLE